MKEEWNSQLENSLVVDYSIERSSDPLWTVTAQARGSVILHQDNIKPPVKKADVEAHFRDDLMNER
jgi:hypothetical protein